MAIVGSFAYEDDFLQAARLLRSFTSPLRSRPTGAYEFPRSGLVVQGTRRAFDGRNQLLRRESCCSGPCCSSFWH